MPTRRATTRKGRLLRRSAEVVGVHVLTWSVLLLTLWFGVRYAADHVCPDGKHLESFGMPGVMCTYERPGD